MSDISSNQLAEDQSLFAEDNHLFELARLGHLHLPGSLQEKQPVLINKLLYPLAAILFGFMVPILSGILGPSLLLMVITTPVARGSASEQFVFLVGAFLPFFLLIWLWLWLFERRSLWTTGMERPFLKKYLRGLGVGLLMFIAAVAILALLNSVALEAPINSSLSLLSLSGALVIFLGWMVQGAAEEVLTRGFLLPVIGSRWGALTGVLVSSLIFSILHLLNPNVTLISLLNLALFGLFAALYALNEGGLWGVFAIHAIWNWAQGNLFGFEVSGLGIESGLIFDLMEVGPDWFTGGLFGPEGGTVVTIVLLTSCLLVWIVAKRKRSRNIANA